MGIDMSSFIEIVAPEGQGEQFAAVITDVRDYQFYKLVLEDYFPDNKPIYASRGLPPNIDDNLREDSKGCFGHSWLMKGELKNLLPQIERKETQYRLQAVVAAMENLESNASISTRFVFWFI